ncbi:histidine kinase/DNA gyrase B/HSP90-like ATPase [Maribacter sp. MAR_2009_72]|nr:histidine kinase/DNA gyrase B/HSP90-like ATPase [Maribacter sp. MAR_2009_72]
MIKNVNHNAQDQNTNENSLLDHIGLITLLSALFTFFMFLYTLFNNTRLLQITAFVIFLGFAIGFIMNILKLEKATRLYMSLFPPTMFMIIIVLIGGFFGQALAFATMAFLAFIAYRNKPKIRLAIIIYDIMAFIVPTLYITFYGPILGVINLPYDEILVYIACLIWLSQTFRMYDETKTRKYTNELEKNNTMLKANEKALQTAQSNLEKQNQKLYDLNQDLNKKNKQIEEFTFIVTHDLKSPLNNINIISKHLLDQPNSTTFKEFKEHFEHLEGSSTRMTNLVLGLLEYAETGNSDKMKVIDCQEIVQQIITDHSQLIKNNRATVLINDLPNIVGRERDIRMLFQNLLHNALKFSSVRNAPKIVISSEEKDNFYQFKMSDNGIGISKDQQQNIFKAFNKLHHQSEFEGSGIGLYGCKRVVDIHEGDIWVESIEDQGSTFYFTISKNLQIQEYSQPVH